MQFMKMFFEIIKLGTLKSKVVRSGKRSSKLITPGKFHIVLLIYLLHHIIQVFSVFKEKPKSMMIND